MNLTPINKNVLIRVDAPERKTETGFVLPDNYERPQSAFAGEVMAVAADVTKVRVGDRVLFRGAKTEPVADTEDGRRLVTREDNVLAVFAEAVTEERLTAVETTIRTDHLALLKQLVQAVVDYDTSIYGRAARGEVSLLAGGGGVTLGKDLDVLYDRMAELGKTCAAFWSPSASH